MNLKAPPAATILLSFLALSACAQPAGKTEPPAQEAASDAHPGSCDASVLAWATGQVADEALVERARVQAGAKTVRVLRPGMMVTREFNGDRLNIRVDNERKVLATNCG